MKKEKAVFALGCFWHAQKQFDKLKGIISTQVGYSGGQKENPTYQEVGTGKTGHAESIQIEFDPNKISYQKLLETFWQIHDPTTLNQQGPDIGTQYRSAIFYTNENQKKLAQKSLQEQQKKLTRKITTEIVPFKKFYKAEEYHQKYYLK